MKSAGEVGRPWTGAELRELVKPDRVHRLVYTDPALFELEMERIFGRAWVYVAHESQLRAQGDFVRTRLGRHDVIVARHESGKLHVLQNRCAHRGALFCVVERGNAPGFTCPYHGWTYRLDGSLAGVPHRQSYPQDFSLDDPGNALFRAPRVDTYRGFVFASLSAGGLPLRGHLGVMTEAIDNLVDRAPAGEIEICEVPFRVEYQGNWKLHHENTTDIFHPSFVHASSVSAARGSQPGASRIDNDQTREQLGANAFTSEQWESIELVGLPNGHSYMGGFYQKGILAPNQTNDPVRARYQMALEARHGREAAAAILGINRFNNLIFPNMTLNAQNHQLRILQPIAVDRTLVTAYCFRLKGAPDEIYQRAVRYLNNLSSPASMISSDDFEIFERCQKGLSEEGRDWVDIKRGYGSDREGPNHSVSGSASELPIRAQFAAWLDYMSADPS
jgi:phenylpropionate dioxygenase-like ring-hydroxylating dioxygenase large terminal subunit